MELNYKLFQKVIDDLENHGAKIMVLAHVNGEEIDFTIKARFPSGRTWEVIQIEEE